MDKNTALLKISEETYEFSRLGTSVALPFDFSRLGVSEQALGGIPLGFGIVVEDKPSELSYIF